MSSFHFFFTHNKPTLALLDSKFYMKHTWIFLQCHKRIQKSISEVVPELSSVTECDMISSCLVTHNIFNKFLYSIQFSNSFKSNLMWMRQGILQGKRNEEREARENTLSIYMFWHEVMWFNIKDSGKCDG